MSVREVSVAQAEKTVGDVVETVVEAGVTAFKEMSPQNQQNVIIAALACLTIYGIAKLNHAR